MKVVAINGSHRPGKSTSQLLQMTLGEFIAAGWEAELIELADRHIEFCLGCNACLLGKPCPLLSREDDDMREILDTLHKADAVIVGSPNYFENVSARMKNFFDRTRPAHLAGNTMAGKIAGAVATTGLNNFGIDTTVSTLHRFCEGHGWIVIGATQVVGSWEEGADESGRTRYRKSAALDPKARETALALAKSMMGVASRLAR